MRVSHETIYLSLFVQPRGTLRKQLTRYLRTRRTVGRPRAPDAPAQGQLRDAVDISARPAKLADRAVPGHWEGDLLLGRRNSDVAHELAHILLVHELSRVETIGESTFLSCDPQQKEEAGWLAGCLLLPRELLLREARRGRRASAIAEEYQVSEDMAVFGST